MSRDSDALIDRYLAISRAIAGQLDYQNVSRQVAKEIDSLFQPDHMDIAIVLPNQRTCVSFEVGMMTGWSQIKDPAPVTSSPVRSLLLGEVPNLLTGDAWEDERFHFDGAFDSPIFEAKLHSRMHVPLHVHGVVLGSLNISSQLKDKYTEADLEIAQQVADLLAPYIYAIIRSDQARQAALAEGDARGREEALRLGALRLTEGMEKARRQLGMDLHDQTLADLTRISHQLARIRRQHPTRVADLEALGREIANCITELRRIIEDTKPGVLELFGFAQAVEAQLERSVAGIRPPIRTEVHDRYSSVLDACSESLRTTLYRIVQEAINNAVKHGHPRTVSITIDAADDQLVIEVADDGRGVMPEAHRSTGGLDNMRVRAALISADIDISRDRRKKGTHVTVRIPFRELNRFAREPVLDPSDPPSATFDDPSALAAVGQYWTRK